MSQEALVICKDKMKASLRGPIIHGIKGIYKTAYKNCKNKNTPHLILHEFQTLLQSIITWNSNIVDEATKRITNEVSCFEELMSSIFVGEAKVLSNLKVSEDDHSTIQIKIPLMTRFIHTVYIKVAEKVFYQPELFDHQNEDLSEIEGNNSKIRNFIDQAIDEAIIDLAPVEGILNAILKKEEDSDHNDSDHNDSDHREDHVVPPPVPFSQPNPFNTFIQPPKASDNVGKDSDSESNHTAPFRSISLNSSDNDLFSRKRSISRETFPEYKDSSDDEKTKEPRDPTPEPSSLPWEEDNNSFIWRDSEGPKEAQEGTEPEPKKEDPDPLDNVISNYNFNQNEYKT